MAILILFSRMYNVNFFLQPQWFYIGTQGYNMNLTTICDWMVKLGAGYEVIVDGQGAFQWYATHHIAMVIRPNKINIRVLIQRGIFCYAFSTTKLLEQMRTLVI